MRRAQTKRDNSCAIHHVTTKVTGIKNVVKMVRKITFFLSKFAVTSFDARPAY